MCSACTCTGDQPSTPYRLITPVIAAVDIDWQMTGAVNPDGSARPELRGLLSWVMQRQSDGSWLIVVMHNTPLKGYPAN
jgi:hypothetical protein